MIDVVTRYDAPSRCSGKAPLSLRWYGFPPCNLGQDLSAAVQALFDSVSPPGRVWNPWSSAITRAEFKKRLEKASRGELEPVDEVKPVDARNPPPLYEIRWQGVAVANLKTDGSQEFSEVLVRLYHSEPISQPDYFVAHHAHEKDLSSQDVNAAQNDEISVALAWHDHGIDSNWGIAS